jgi:hypothetical protein
MRNCNHDHVVRRWLLERQIDLVYEAHHWRVGRYRCTLGIVLGTAMGMLGSTLYGRRAHVGRNEAAALPDRLLANGLRLFSLAAYVGLALVF